jgi:stearoyl-CoA desaturase (delta-9 desaturase)
VLSLGESWHNMHHSDPACARHGVDRGQIDLSAELIRVFERFGWARGVRWPTPARLEQRRRGREIFLPAGPRSRPSVHAGGSDRSSPGPG